MGSHHEPSRIWNSALLAPILLKSSMFLLVTTISCKIPLETFGERNHVVTFLRKSTQLTTVCSALHTKTARRGKRIGGWELP